MRRPASHPGALLATLGAAALALAAVPGCNYASTAAYIISGPPEVPAAFDDLPKERKTVVFVDDRSNIVPRRALRRAIGESTEQTLIGEKVLRAEDVIPSGSALYALSQEKRSDTMSVVDVGKAVGADIVIYVGMNQFTLARNGQDSYQPGASGFVKVFDTASNKRIWPPDSGRGYAVSYLDPNPKAEVPKTSTEKSRAEDDLARDFGVRAARLFFKHKPETASDKRIEK